MSLKSDLHVPGSAMVADVGRVGSFSSRGEGVDKVDKKVVGAGYGLARTIKGTT
jgi:hypothetical protein